MTDFPEFPKIPRLSRECTITEKIDGTNGLIRLTKSAAIIDEHTTIEPQLHLEVGSRTRWIVPGDDNYGFAKWAHENFEELKKLGEGDHYGEWWGSGIQKRYQNQPKTFSLFNTKRWADDAIRPKCCSVVPILYQGIFSDIEVSAVIERLRVHGSKANPGCMRPEGIIIWHHAAQIYFKKTLDKDEEWKGKQQG